MIKEIYMAGGCFWGVEEYFQRIHGVIDTEVGYINSKIENPSYEQVCNEKTDAAEAVRLLYDDDWISLTDILDRYYEIIDPFSVNRQGMDIGSQYRTGLYYRDTELRDKLLADRTSRQKFLDKQIQVEVEHIDNFFRAEDLHQRYLQKNPNGYCHIILPEKYK